MNLMRLTPVAALSVLLSVLLAVAPADAHPNHPAEVTTAGVAVAEGSGVTGAGDLRFKYRADLSALPEAIAAGIKRAHGGFAVGPGREIYFGLKGNRRRAGVARPAREDAHLRRRRDAARRAAQHDVPRPVGRAARAAGQREGADLLRPPDGRTGRDGRPTGGHDYYADLANRYAPTDTEIVGEGDLCVSDGYSPGKYVLWVDLDSMAYKPEYFGGRVSGKGREEGKFSTNHGVTLDPADGSLLIADRERFWVQRMTPGGEFVEGIDMNGAAVCDVAFVDWRGERLLVAGCLKGEDERPGVVHLLRDKKIVSTLRPKEDLGLEAFQHIHNAIAVVVDGSCSCSATAGTRAATRCWSTWRGKQ